MPDVAELRRQIEELALRAVIGSPGPAGDAADLEIWIPALEKIRDAAAGQQASQLAAVAAETIENLRRTPSDNAASSAELQEGITRLQQAIDVGIQSTVPCDGSLAQDPELLSDFVLESREHLASVEAQVLTLERDPRDAEALNAVFRGFHTIKGLAGFLEMWEVQKLAHEVETVLDSARNFHLDITPLAIDVILQSADQLRRWLAHVEAKLQNLQPETPPKNDALLERIRALSAMAPEARPASHELAAMATAVETSNEKPAAPPAAPPSHRSETMAVKVNTAKLDYLVDMAGEMVIAESLVRHDPDLAATKSPASAAQPGATDAHHSRTAKDLHGDAAGAHRTVVPEDGEAGKRPLAAVRQTSADGDRRRRNRTGP